MRVRCGTPASDDFCSGEASPQQDADFYEAPATQPASTGSFAGEYKPRLAITDGLRRLPGVKVAHATEYGKLDTVWRRCAIRAIRKRIGGADASRLIEMPPGRKRQRELANPRQVRA